MIDALISGKLHGKPQPRTSRTGTRFTIAKLRAAQGDGETLFVSVIAFDATPCQTLLALDDGDAVALAGSLTVKIWESNDGPRPAADLIASQALTAYQAKKKREAVAAASRPQSQEPGFVGDDWEGAIHLWLTFFPPDRRHRDDDNIIASFKAGRDGIADALGIDDTRFRSHPWVSDDPVKGGAVRVRLTPGSVCPD